MSNDLVPPHFSYSSLSTYLKCGEQYRLQKIEHVPEIPSWWFVGGRAFHTVTEIIDLEPEKFRKSGLDQLWADVFNAEVSAQAEKFPDLTQWRTAGKKKANPDGEDYLTWMDLGPLFTQRYLDWRESFSEWRIWEGAIAGYDPETNSFEPFGPAVELPISVPIGGWAMKGSVDRVYEHKTSGTLLVVDFKTGARMPEGDLQLGTYAVGMELQYGQRPDWGAYFNPRQNKMSSMYNLASYTVDYIAQMGVSFRRGIQNKVFIPHKTNLCNYCPVNRGCATFGGEDAHLYQIQDGPNE